MYINRKVVFHRLSLWTFFWLLDLTLKAINVIYKEVDICNFIKTLNGIHCIFFYINRSFRKETGNRK